MDNGLHPFHSEIPTMETFLESFKKAMRQQATKEPLLSLLFQLDVKGDVSFSDATVPVVDILKNLELYPQTLLNTLPKVGHLNVMFVIPNRRILLDCCFILELPTLVHGMSHRTRNYCYLLT